MMSVASCDHCRGISASGISKTTEPSGLVIRLVRFSYCTVLKASCPCLVKRREIFMNTSSSQAYGFQFLQKQRATDSPTRPAGPRRTAKWKEISLSKSTDDEPASDRKWNLP